MSRVPAALAALLLAAGCGESGPTPEEQVRSTVAEFGRATETKDYQALCDRLLAPELVEEIESIGLPCESAMRQALEDVRDPRLTIGRVEVDGERASADVRTTATGQEPSRDTLQLILVGETWKVSSLGS